MQSVSTLSVTPAFTAPIPDEAIIEIDGVKLKALYHYEEATAADIGHVIEAQVEVIEVYALGLPGSEPVDITGICEFDSALGEKIDKLVLAAAEDDSL